MIKQKIEHCFECGCIAVENHHVVPKSKGGTKTVPLCSVCHGKVHGMYRTNISFVTKKALMLKKIREPDWKPGSPVPMTKECRDKAHKSISHKAKTDPVVLNALAMIAPLRKQNYSLQKIADKLNAEGYKTRTGKQFAVKQVWDIINRFKNK